MKEDTLIRERIISNYNLTKGQLKAFHSMCDFMHSSEKNFVLIGKAGTGKTFVLALVLEYYNKTKKGDFFFDAESDVIGLTVSHKAKSVLSKSIPNSTTIASGLGMKVKYNFKGEVEFEVVKNAPRKPLVASARLVIVDECSMITKYVFKAIKTHSNPMAKIIYVGDHHQLPPIEASRELDSNSVTFDIKNKAELTELVRQKKGSPIIESASLIADEIDSENPSLEVVSSLKTNFDKDTQEGVVLTNKEKALNSFVNYLQGMYDNYNEYKINTFYIGYKNLTVSRVNKLVRNKVLKTKEQFVPRDRIIALSNYYIGKEVLLFNSSIYEIERVEDGMYNRVPVKFLYFKGVKKAIPVVSKEGKKAYKAELEEYLYEAKNNFKWKEYYKFKESFALVDYAYAISSHKSQGSTYDSTYADVSDILSVGPTTEKEKLQSIYVAITRAKSKLIIF